MVAFLVATVPLLAAIDSPSKLHPNIGGVSIESYNSSNSGQIPNCTESTVRACYQSILQTFRSQEASGVRFRFSLYQAMERSGSDYQVKASWLSNLDTFLGDIAAAGYTNVIPSPQFSGWQGEGKQVERVVVEGGGCPHGNGTEIDLTFWPTAPFGWDANGPYAGGFNQSYNCSPQNPIFVGWDNIY